MNKHVAATTLGVVMIVKNEEKSLGGILSDIKDVVDEICIVDTGSTDRTIPIAGSFSARIEHFPWRNDFSAARNYSISCAKSDYLLWLDADDRIDEDDRRAIRRLKASLRPEKDKAYMLKILGRSKDMPDTVSLQTRIIPNREGVLFEGKIHEQILPSLKRCAITVEPVEITIRHTGYHDAEARFEKGRRNLDILMEELRGGKDTATQCFFIAMACIGIEDYEQCLEYLAKARQKRTDEDWYHFSFTVSTDCLLRLKRLEEAREEITRGIALFKESPLLHYYHGIVCLQAELFPEAAQALGKAAALTPRIDSYPAPPDLKTIILLQHGKALEKTGRLNEAIETYTHALKKGSLQKDLHYALGMALLQGGKIDDALGHLSMAKELSGTVDVSLWLSLAKIHGYRKSHEKAHALYIDILDGSPLNLPSLAGLLGTSIELDDIESFFLALEQLLLLLEIPLPETEITSLAQCADLCIEIGHHLRDRSETSQAMHLAETALRLDESSSGAHLLLADLFFDTGDTARMAASLEMALKNGADRQEVLRRIDPVRQTGNAES